MVVVGVLVIRIVKPVRLGDVGLQVRTGKVETELFPAFQKNAGATDEMGHRKRSWCGG